jgi:serine/threonine protein kinase
MVEWLDTTRFRLIRPLSQGGMGQVLLAKQLSLGRLVIIKTVIEVKARYYERLKREAHAGSLLSHKHVVSVIDYYGSEDDRNRPPYIVMEYVEGPSLDKQPIKDFSQALDIGYQIAEALFYIHDHNIVHCDIKPHNVFLTKEPTPSPMPGQRGERLIAKVGDFGIALLPQQPHITEAGGFLGSLAWAAPEQVTSPESVDTRADLYSFGLTLLSWLLSTSVRKKVSPLAFHTFFDE